MTWEIKGDIWHLLLFVRMLLYLSAWICTLALLARFGFRLYVFRFVGILPIMDEVMDSEIIIIINE